VGSNLLVTGCAGMIGARLVEHLLAQGHWVIGVDNVHPGNADPVQRWRLTRLLDLARFQYHRVDIRDRSALRAPFAGSAVDAVIHLAARTGVRASASDAEDYVATNVLGTRHVLEECRDHGVPKFVLASSSSVYGNSARPSREEAIGQPLSVYAATKRAAEELTRHHHERFGLDVTVLRYFTVYGIAGRPDMAVFQFIQRIAEGLPVIIFGDGSQRRDFTYLDEIVRGTTAGLCPLGFEVLNLGSDRPAAVLDVIRQIERLLGREANLEFRAPDPADTAETWAEISKARSILGWSPLVALPVGLRRCVDWYLEYRASTSAVPDSGIENLGLLGGESSPRVGV
jgi:nucleoside-diphosphate-sugar epimerase